MKKFGFTIPGVFRTPFKFQRPSKAHRLTIPTEFESSADFITRAFELFQDRGTWVYLDTSFLMWMTKIGPVSRAELVSWLEKQCAGRIQVPVWAAHEYLRHHTSKTLIEDLNSKISEIDRVAKSTYRYLRPFLDAPLGTSAEMPEAQQAAVRNLLNELQQLATNAKKWAKNYTPNSTEVIAFINN